MKTNEKENDDIPLPPNPDVSDIEILLVFLGVVLFISALVLVGHLINIEEFTVGEGIFFLWFAFEIILVTVGSFCEFCEKWRKMKEREKE
jgi:hypothetical protein